MYVSITTTLIFAVVKVTKTFDVIIVVLESSLPLGLYATFWQPLVMRIVSISAIRGRYVSIEEALCITLWYLANRVSMRDLGDRFNVAKSTVLPVPNMVGKVCDILAEQAATIIKWLTENEAEHTAAEFEALAVFLVSSPVIIIFRYCIRLF